MTLRGFTPLWYILALLLALVSQRNEACGDVPEPEQIKIVMPVP